MSKPRVKAHNSRPPSGFGPRPYVEETEPHVTAPGMGAEFSDRAERAAGRRYGSAYASTIALPDSVGAGDHAEARAIHERISQALEDGGWTKNEWQRLHRMEEAWRLRASGRDVGFNLRGWKRQGTGHHTPALEKTIREMRRLFDGND